MIYSSLLAAVQSTVPPTPAWNPTIGAVMIICNLLALFVFGRLIRYPNVGPSLPMSLPGLPENFSVPALIATACFGHILGAGAILGLTNAGVL